MKKVLLILSVVLAVFSLFVSCDNNPDVVRYHVTVRNDGEVYKEKDVADGDVYVLPAKPRNDSRPFRGWLVGENTLQPGEEVKISADTVITAVWTETCTVSFDLGDETLGKIESLTVEKGGTVKKPATPSRTGYTFSSWKLNGNDFSFDTPITESITLVAEWSINTYTVTFDLCDSSLDKIDDETVDYGAHATEPLSSSIPNRTGYAFAGWYLNEEKYDFGNAVVTEDITLKAHWTTNYCTVTFDTNGGEAMSSLKIPYGEKINIAGTPAEPTRIGYTFVKWTLADGTDFSYDYVIESDTDLKAQWQTKSCTVSFDLCDDSLKKISDKSVDYGNTVQEPASSDIPDRPGYVFDGWYFNEEEYVFSSPVTEDMILKAHWTANYYTVIFNTVGGSSVPSLKIKYGERINLVSKPQPTREGYVFNGWKNSDGSDFDFSTEITSSITLKADWISASKCATVTLKDSSGSIIRKDTVLIGNTYTIPDLGYTIASCTDGDGNNVNTESLTINESTVLTIEKGKYKKYEIGDIGPGGGYIVFDADYNGSDEKYISEFKNYSSSKLGWRYLEAAESDLEWSYVFGYYRESGTNISTVSEADGKEIGKGKSNTQSLVEKMGKTSLSKDSGEDEDEYAAYAAQSYDGGGFSDWFLPSIEELEMLKLLNKKSMGNVKMGFTNHYWSSTEYVDGTKANSKSFDSIGVISGYPDERSTKNYVRPFRCF